MDDAYRGYFIDRIQMLVNDPAADEAPGGSRAHRAAINAMDASRMEIPPGFDIRPDASLLLYLVSAELVARPVLSVEAGAAEELEEDLRADAATVTRAAVERADGEVSAHAIVDGLSASWPELRTGRWRVWDRHRGPS